MTTIEVIGNAMMFFGSYCFAKDIIAPLVRSVFYNKKKRKYDQKIIELDTGEIDLYGINFTKTNT